MTEGNTMPRPPAQPNAQGGHPILLGLIMLCVAACLLALKVWGERPSHQLAHRAVCQAVLRSCGKALAVYANHSGSFPADIDILVQQRFAQPAQFLCPGSQPASDYESVVGAYTVDQPISPRLHELMRSCYVYIPSQKVPADSAGVLMYEKNSCHPKDGGNVLFGDYHVEWVEPYSKVEELVARTKQRLATSIPSPEDCP